MKIQITYFSGGFCLNVGKETLQWWIQGRGPGARLPPPLTLFLDQNEARRAEKIFF